MYTACYKARYVGHVHKQYRADLICDCPEAGKIYESGIGACTCDYQLRPGFLRKPLDLVIVYRLGLPADPVANYVIETAREVYRVSVGKVSAVVKLHRKDGISGIDCREEDCLVGARTGMGLDICMVGTEEFTCPLDRDLLYLFNEFTASVVLFVGVSFCVFIREDGALYFEQGTGDEILRCDQLYMDPLSFKLALRKSVYLRIQAFKCLCHYFIHQLHSFSLILYPIPALYQFKDRMKENIAAVLQVFGFGPFFGTVAPSPPRGHEYHYGGTE